MAKMALTFPIYFALLAVSSAAAPTADADTIGSDLHFLHQNDLNWPTAHDHNGTILLDSPKTHSEAIGACQLLHEDLLPTSGVYIDSDITNLIKYLEYDGKAEPQQSFWVAGTNATDCQSYSRGGGIEHTPCTFKLPTFCGQSAPYKRNTDLDRNPDYEVQVQSGRIIFLGHRDHLSFRFVGIPYANPVKRFEYSTPYTVSSPNIIPSTFYGPPCPQPGASGKEDCLFLNIYTPFIPQDPEEAKAKKKLKPVLFWIHGGGFTLGEGASPMFDGGNMASRNDLVYVSINYRLGTLGFLALDDGIVNGNFAIADQITALKWVHEHISAFGGDPSRVTIYGESAGGASVRALLSSPPAFGLFGGAIAQSNLGGFGFARAVSDFISVAEEYNTYDEPFIKSLGCGKESTTDVIACLRAVPVDKISANPIQRNPVVDGYYIPGPRIGVAGNAPVAPAHVIFGWMKEDGALFSGALPAEDVNQTQSLVASGVPSDLAEIVVANPDIFQPSTGPNSTINMFNLTTRIVTAGSFSCADQAIVKSAGKHQVFPSVYAYSFDRSYSVGGYVSGLCMPPKSEEFPNGDPSQPYFKCHAGELYYTAGTLGQESYPFRDDGDLLLSQVTVDAWGAFARTFNPNPSFDYLAARGYNSSAEAFKSAGPWEPATPSTDTPLRLMDVPLRSVAWRDTEQCELLGLPESMYDAPMILESGHWVEQKVECVAPDTPSIKILWVNAVNSSLYDKAIAQEIAKIKSPNAEVHVVSLDLGQRLKVTNLEYRIYEVQILKPVAHLAHYANVNGFDAFAIGCFYDTGFHEAREVSGETIVRAPCEASLQIASTLGNRISIIIGHEKWKVQMEDQVRAYGYSNKLASFRTLDMHVEDFQKAPATTKESIRKAIMLAVEEDGAEVIVLGCTIEYGFGEDLQKELGIPIIDAVQACYKQAELSALLKKQIGLRPSRLRGMAPPSQQDIEDSGIFSGDPPIGNHIVIEKLDK